MLVSTTFRAPAPAQETKDGPIHPNATSPIAYHTIDDVNRSTMTRLAGLFRIQVDHVEPRDRPSTAPALVYDVDYWWDNFPERTRGLQQLVANSGDRVIAVHGWTLDNPQLDWLRANRVIAQTQLNLALVSLLARALQG